MNKKELQEKLDTIGATYDKRWGAKRLEAVVKELQGSEADKAKNIADSVSGKDTVTVEDMLEDTTRVDGDAITRAGIIIPAKVLAKLPKTKFLYVVQYSQEVAEVNKVDSAGRKTFVRAYERCVHGDNFKELARQFVDKNNN